jgi:WD40 repeat protein
VGDYSSSLLIDSTTGEVLRQMSGHRDYGFACDWSDDGRTVATGFQDKRIMVWDARRWCDSRGVDTPLQVIRTNMGSPRSLRFSPLGSGRNVLAAAEDADFVHVIDGQLYRSKQTFDMFGEIGGISFANDGQNLNVLCADRDRGGLVQFERCGHGPEPMLENKGFDDDGEDKDEIANKYDGWKPAYSRTCRPRLARALPTWGGLEPF